MPPSPGRRRMLAAGGALVMAFALGTGPARGGGAARPGSLKKTPHLDSWIRIDADNRITVFTGKAELGQGIKTALIQLAADELMVPPQRIALVTADTARTPNEQYTAGSHSMQDSGTAIRHAAAQVRLLLAQRAAARLGAPVDSLAIADGVVSARDGRKLSYGELVQGQNLHVEAQPTSPLLAPQKRRSIGQSFPRVDIPAKLSGGAAYVQDMRPQGMVHARVVRPGAPGATLEALDTTAVAAMPGVLKVVVDGSFVGVIAQREYTAIIAAQRLAKAARWRQGAALPDEARLYDTLLALPSVDSRILDRGNIGTTRRGITATYRKPYGMHASIGPSCAIAQRTGDSYCVWSHTQGVYPLRGALAEMLGVEEDRVRCIHVEGSGCYGHNGADDVAADAVLLARAFPERPVRLQWMREDEHAWEPYGPAMVARVSAALGADGAIASWEYEVWSNTHSTRPGRAGNLLAATLLAQPFTPPPPEPLPQPEGGGDRNAIPLYALPNARVTHHFLPEMPLRVSALRSLGAYCNVFAIESFMDELARAAYVDPVRFRLRHMQDARAIDVMREAARRFGWENFRRREGRGRGFAFARYKNLGAYAAIAVEVEVQRATGLVRLLRAVAAVDSGEAVNPDGIRNQIEGGIIQSCSWTLCEAVRFSRESVQSIDWGGYPILRFTQIPESIEVFVIDRPGQPFLGTGEAAQGPSAAAIANAVADAVDLRLRDLPLSRERVGAAMGA
ncbi:xanthine dehydrogenase family protein molybdopterin-binding subunit [Noviherbaspirillum sp. DKR-6]|uniref:Xanthine dehydrogenase family protein molybdopterin-binding subunit n=2 Tax=Noviherbaspirillum pedocola TaxID=2801341 RepID=A0A934W9D9_9BURK|nr:xanthine dehydrogenase family protein molybdopterin-binding subunit [Noviherbaspirillum pedocola]